MSAIPGTSNKSLHDALRVLASDIRIQFWVDRLERENAELKIRAETLERENAVLLDCFATINVVAKVDYDDPLVPSEHEEVAYIGRVEMRDARRVLLGLRNEEAKS